MFKQLVVFALVALAASQKGYESSLDSVKIQEPAPIEYAQQGAILAQAPLDFAPVANLESEIIDVPAPNVELTNPQVSLTKETPEVVDIPHVPINLPGNKIEEQDVVINVPSPIIESPKPIFQEKPTIFRVPQPIIQVPKPIIEHHPVYYRVPHAVRYPNNYIQPQPYLANGPSVAAYPVNSLPATKSVNTYPVNTYPASKTVYTSVNAPATARKTFSFSMNFNPCPVSGKTIVKHFTFGKK